MSIKAIVFDCFGVLLTDALSLMLDEFRTEDSAKADRISGIINAASRGVIDSATSRAAVAAELGLTENEYAARIRSGEVKNTALFEYIDELHMSYKTALLSNISKNGIEVRFPGDELLKYFDVVVASGDIGFAKPDTRAYEIVAERLGLKPEACIMIDDRPDYCEGARAAGMTAILYESNQQLFAALAKYS